VDTSGKGLKELRNKVGLVFQYPEHQLFEETVYKDIAFGLKGLESREIDQRVNAAISAVGLKPEVLQRSPFELSGGQKRRSAMAGVLAMRPEILVIDEPTAGLDPAGRDEILGIISSLKGLTMIMVSHSMEDIARIADRIIVMDLGRVRMDGTPGEIFRQAGNLEDMGLAAPQITYLMKRLKNRMPGINDSIFTVHDARMEIEKYLG
jgi:energy-coupling factor transport system ATP-binding protein